MSDAESRRTHAGGTGGRERWTGWSPLPVATPASRLNRFSVAGLVLVGAAWLMWFLWETLEDMGFGFDARLMLGSNLLGFVSAVIGLQQSNRERNQNEASFDPRSRTFAKTALVLAIPGLLLLGLLLTLCGDPNVINC